MTASLEMSQMKVIVTFHLKYRYFIQSLVQ